MEVNDYWLVNFPPESICDYKLLMGGPWTAPPFTKYRLQHTNWAACPFLNDICELFWWLVWWKWPRLQWLYRWGLELCVTPLFVCALLIISNTVKETETDTAAVASALKWWHVAYSYSSPKSLCRTASLYPSACLCASRTVFNRRHIMATTMTPCILTTGPASVEEAPWPGLVQRINLADTRCVLLLSLCWHTRHMVAPDVHPKNIAFIVALLLEQKWMLTQYELAATGNHNEPLVISACM